MTRPWLVAGLALVLVVGCRPDDQRTDTVDAEVWAEQRAQLSPEFRALLDSGSAAFRRDDYEAALELYTEATEQDPNVPAAWFGMFMAHQELGNTTEAEEALERARSAVPGATLIHPTDTLR